MKVVLFCGGLGLRLRDHEPRIPKPVVPLGGEPLVLHVMRYYAHFGYNDFIMCLGYKGDAVKAALEESLYAHESGRAFEFDGTSQDIRNWKIEFVDTGMNATIAERLVAIRPYLDPGTTFFANYSDSLTDADLPQLLAEHRRHRALASFMCVRPHLSLHNVEVDGSTGKVSAIRSIREAIRINGGFFTLEPEVLDHIRPGDELVEGPFERLISAGRLHGHMYDGFWSTIDTFKDHMRLSAVLSQGPGPWQVWRRDEHRSLGAAGS